MSCRVCESPRIVAVNAKCSDMCFVNIADKEHDGYVPTDMGIGGRDYIDMRVCLNCGAVQGTFPLPRTELEGEEDLTIPMFS